MNGWCRLFVKNEVYSSSMAMRKLIRRYSAESPLRRLLEGAASFTESVPESEVEEQRWATEPYTHAPEHARGRQRLEPDEHAVLLFPGAEQHYVGMGRRLLSAPAARDLYQIAGEILKMDVIRACTEGPAELLARHADECVLATSLAALELLREERPEAWERARAVAGYRLGELTAFAAVGALALPDALRLAALRSAALEAARRAEPEVAAIAWFEPAARGLPAGVRVVAHLHAGCRLVSGPSAAVSALEASPGRWGVWRTERAGPWAGPDALARASDAVRAGAEGVEVRAPAAWGMRVMCGSGRWVRSAARARARVWRGLSEPFRWEQSLHSMFARARGEKFPRTYCVGPGRWTRASLRHVNARAWDHSVQVDA